MFEQENIDAIMNFYATYPRYAEILSYRELTESVGTVRNIFYGDSITQAWPLHEFFPNHSILNRGIGGDSVYGLYQRMDFDIFPYNPGRVIMTVGINQIGETAERIYDHIMALADMMRKKDISMVLGSILPVREPAPRVEHQDKIVEINEMLRQGADSEGYGFVDYHSAMKDETGQLAAEYTVEDGIHVTLPGYQVMAKLVRPFLLD